MLCIESHLGVVVPQITHLEANPAGNIVVVECNPDFGEAKVIDHVPVDHVPVTRCTGLVS